MKNSFLIVFVIFCSTALLGQEADITWGEIQKKQGQLHEVLTDKAGEFYTLRWLGGNIGGSYQVTRNVGLKRVVRNRIRLVVNKSIANFEAVGIVDGDFAVFLSDKQDGQHKLFIQKYDEDLEPKGDQKMLASYDLQTAVKGEFKIIFSSNGDYVGISWILPGKKDRRLVYGFNVYNKDLVKVNDGEYPLKFEPKYVRVLEHYISNTGDYFMAFAQFQDAEKSFLRTTQEFKELHVYHIDSNGLQDLFIDVDGRRIEAMAMSTNEKDEFMVTGIFGLNNVIGVSGMFHKKMKLSNGDVIQESYKEFEDEFITEGWSDRALDRAEKRVSKGKGDVHLEHYQMKEATTLDDGSVIGTMEQYYVQVQSSSDVTRNQSSDRYYYYFNDIIAFKILPDGEFDWITKIRKYQVSMNDGGPFSSYAIYNSDSTLNFVFNDNRMNYTEDGAFKTGDDLYVANYGRKKNVVALAKLNVNTGEIQRESFFNRSEIDAIAVPKKFNVNYATREIILYAIWGRNERIGSMSF